MVKIKWLITDVLEDVSLDEFNKEWNGIFGYFEMCINNRVLGFCPERKLLLGEEGNEDILFWLFKLSDAIIQLNDDQEYEIPLFSMNLAKIIFKKDDNLMIKFVDFNTDEIIWSEKIILQEFCEEIKLNVKNFINQILKVNSVLLYSNSLKKLTKLKEMLN